MCKLISNRGLQSFLGVFVPLCVLYGCTVCVIVAHGDCSNNCFYVIARSCFLRVISTIALPTNAVQVVDSGGAACALAPCTDRAPVLLTCTSRSAHNILHLCKETAPTHSSLLSLHIPFHSRLWPGIFKPRQLINEFHSGCLRAILITRPKAVKKAVGELSVSQVWHHHFGLGKATVKESNAF